MLAAPLWERVADQESLAHSRMNAVAGGPGGFVAVGSTDAEEPAGAGLAWTSADGRTWTRAAQAPADGVPTAIMRDVNGYVAWGYTGTAAVVWTSVDGQSWQRATDIPSFQDVSVMFVARLGNQLVAIGGATDPENGQLVDRFKTWSSEDGLAWQPVISATQPPKVDLDGMTAWNGMLIAWGWIFADGAFRAVTLRSTDGLAWERDFVSEADYLIGDIVGVEGPLVAVGHGPYCCEAGATAPVAAWTFPSAGGLTWAAATFQPAPGNDQLDMVVRYGGRYVALGTNYATPITWMSDDGTVWTEDASAPDADAEGDPCTGGPCPYTTVNGLAGSAPGLVAVGATRLEDDEGNQIGWRSVVWIAPAVAG